MIIAVVEMLHDTHLHSVHTRCPTHFLCNSHACSKYHTEKSKTCCHLVKNHPSYALHSLMDGMYNITCDMNHPKCNRLQWNMTNCILTIAHSYLLIHSLIPSLLLSDNIEEMFFRNQDFFLGSCTHTTKTANPWWRVDLGDICTIFRVVIYNRGDGGVGMYNYNWGDGIDTG